MVNGLTAIAIFEGLEGEAIENFVNERMQLTQEVSQEIFGDEYQPEAQNFDNELIF